MGCTVHPPDAAPAGSLGGRRSLTRRYRPSALTASIALSAALVPPVAATFAWGGVPQLLGLGLMPVAMRLLAIAMTTGSRTAWFRAGALAALVGLTSTVVTVLLGAAALLMLLVAFVHHGARGLSGVVAAFPPLAPVGALYVLILSRMSLPDGRTTAATGMAAIEHGLGAPTSLWMVLLVVLAVSAVVASRSPSIDDRGLLLVGCLGVAVAGVMLGDVRFVAGIPTAIALAAALGPAGASRASTVRMLAVGALLALAVTGAGTQGRQLGFYAQFVPPTVLEDAAIIARSIPADARVAVPPVAGAPTGWWLEGLGIDAAVASRSDWLSFPQERAAAAEVLRLFSAPGWPDEAVANTACSMGVPWLYVPDAWGGMDRAALDREVSAGRLITVQRLPGGLLVRSAAC